MRAWLAAAALAICAALSASSFAADADSLFDADELKAFLPDKTLEGESASGALFAAYFSPSLAPRRQSLLRVLRRWQRELCKDRPEARRDVLRQDRGLIPRHAP